MKVEHYGCGSGPPEARLPTAPDALLFSFAQPWRFLAGRLGAKRVIAVDVTFPPEQADLGDPFDALSQGFSILTRNLALEERARADLIIEPKLPEHHDMSRATLKALVDAGERAALEAMPKLLEFSRKN